MVGGWSPGTTCDVGSNSFTAICKNVSKEVNEGGKHNSCTSFIGEDGVSSCTGLMASVSDSVRNAGGGGGED